MAPEKYAVLCEYKSPYPNSIPFQSGEPVIVGQEFKGDPDWKDWLWCEGKGGSKAWVPKQFLKVKSHETRLARDYDARELSVTAGELVLVHELVNAFAWAEKSD